ncbi:hypothetical protein CSUB01_12698, partial [Colletotrichum sublineola]
YGEVDAGQITPDQPYNFTLKNGDNGSTIDLLTCWVVVDQPLNERDEHLKALSDVPEPGRLYKPFPSDIKVRLWWSTDGDNLFRARLLRQFRDGKTGLDAIMRTTRGRNLEDHCQMLNPHDPKTANIVYFATTRAVNECQSLRHLLSPQAKETMAQEDVDAVYLAGDIIDTRYASEDSLGDGI